MIHPPPSMFTLKSSKTKNKSRFRSGFTLIELLVVIAIIAILAAMLLPALASAKTPGEAYSMRIEPQAVGHGLSMYANENDDSMPAGWYDPNGMWMTALVP